MGQGASKDGNTTSDVSYRLEPTTKDKNQLVRAKESINKHLDLVKTNTASNPTKVAGPFDQFMLPKPSDQAEPLKSDPGFLQVQISRLLFRIELSTHLKSTFRGKIYYGWADRSSMFLTPSLLAPSFVLFKFRYKKSNKISALLSVYTCISYFLFCSLYLGQKEFIHWMCKDHPLSEFGRRQYLLRFGGEAEEWGRLFVRIERERTGIQVKETQG